ncbi:MAG TPA: 4'-phosphopantetheinyl transferase superfamily protein [Dongiaceae bacterium]|nr:4'-phosphopantetheinyl transferase superfamily protein [Dongiaceae bacterium]
MYIVTLLNTRLVNDAIKTKALSFLSPEEVQRYGRFRHASDANLFLFGRYLARCLVAHVSARRPEDVVILVDGIATKPYESKHVIEFSISHSGTFVAVAVSRRPVGIDVQVHDQEQTDVFDSFFTTEEKDYAHQSFKSFYRLWTSVESLAKITGLGFNEALMNRTPYFEGDLRGYTFNQTSYYISALIQTEDLTLSVVAPEDAVFRKCSLTRAGLLTGIDTDELSLEVYSGSVDSDV